MLMTETLQIKSNDQVQICNSKVVWPVEIILYVAINQTFLLFFIAVLFIRK